MARRLNPEAAFSGNWTSIAGAIDGILHFSGLRLDEPVLMGLSGHAFRFAIAESEAGVASAESPFYIDYRRSIDLYSGLGLSWDTDGCWPDDADCVGHRERLLARIQRSIDRGMPCAIYGLQVAEFGIVNGYDERAGLLFVSTNVSPQYGSSLPVAQWPAPGHSPILRGLFPLGKSNVDRPTAELQGLRFAVEYAYHGDLHAPSGIAHGLAAYKRWLESYERGLPIDAIGNRRCIQILQSARRDAGAFLTSIANRLPNEADRLRAVARDYELETLALSRMATLFPYPGGGDIDSRGIREAAAASLREAFGLEQKAVASLALIVRSLDRG
jgi:hypothetical protein